MIITNSAKEFGMLALKADKNELSYQSNQHAAEFKIAGVKVVLIAGGDAVMQAVNELKGKGFQALEELKTVI